MTLVAHTVTTGTSVPSGTQAGDFVIVIATMPNPRAIAASTSWLRHIGMGVYAGVYQPGATISGSGQIVILVYRPDQGEQLTASVVPIFSNLNTTGTIALPTAGDLWGIFYSVTSAPTWGGTYSPAVYNSTYTLAYARLANIESGEISLSASRGGAAYSLGIAVYPATGVAPDPSAWTQAIEGQARVVVGGTDISAHVLSLEIVDELDAPGPTATLIVDRGALHPDLPGSPLQLAAPVEIVGLYRPVGNPTWQGAPMLIGRVGAIDPSRHEMTVQVYDASEGLLSTWLESELELTGSERLAIRMSKMLYQAKIPASIYESSIISVGGTQRFGRRPIWEMLRESAAYCGGSRLRWKYDYPAKTWRLVLYTPNRSASTPDYVFGTNDIIDLGASRLGLEDVRNVVQVVYGPPTQRSLLTAEASDSIAQYGRRVARIEEASDSVVDTQSEAQALAAAVLADLSQPMRGARLSIPWAPFVRVHDVVRINADGHVLKQALTGGVSRVRHRLSREEARTELEVQGNRNPGLYRYWLSREAGRPGIVAATPNWRPSTPITPSGLQAVATPRGILVTWPEERDPHYVETLVYFDTSFLPSTLWGRVSGTSVLIPFLSNGQPLTPDTTYYARIMHRYRDGRTSPFSTAVQVTAVGLAANTYVYTSDTSEWSISPLSSWVDVPSGQIALTAPTAGLIIVGYSAVGRVDLAVTADSTSPTLITGDIQLRYTQTSGPTISNIIGLTLGRMFIASGAPNTTRVLDERRRMTVSWAVPISVQAGTYGFKLQAFGQILTLGGETYTYTLSLMQRVVWAVFIHT